MARRMTTGTLLMLGLMSTLLMLGPGSAGAGSAIRTGKYNGSTNQNAVASNFRTLQFRVTRSRVTLLTEPTVARQYCTSAPTFTIDGNTPSKRLSRNRTFTLTRTFIGNKFDKIHGRFVRSNRINGWAIYHFNQQALCSGGKVKVNFSATRK